MFTGIVECSGKIAAVQNTGSNRTFWIDSSIASQLHIDESICHNGICLTIEEIQNSTHRVTAIKETLDKTNAGNWKAGDLVNLERSMMVNSRINGHIVQGHVDDTARCVERKEMNGSWEFTFVFNKKFASLIIEKGSICLDGVSLTAFKVKKKKFTVAIIPYTFNHTNFSLIREGSKVNIEFDILGKYVRRIALLS